MKIKLFHLLTFFFILALISNTSANPNLIKSPNKSYWVLDPNRATTTLKVTFNSSIDTTLSFNIVFRMIATNQSCDNSYDKIFGGTNSPVVNGLSVKQLVYPDEKYETEINPWAIFGQVIDVASVNISYNSTADIHGKDNNPYLCISYNAEGYSENYGIIKLYRNSVPALDSLMNLVFGFDVILALLALFPLVILNKRNQLKSNLN